MGKILKPRGLNGQLWVAVFNEINSVLDTGMSIWISSKDGRNIHKIIDSIKFFSSKSLIKFKDCNSRNDVEKYVGLKFSISRNTTQAFNAGCDIVLHCNGKYNEMLMVAENSPLLSSFVLKKTSQLLNIIR